jgi:hypothetical protein
MNGPAELLALQKEVLLARSSLCRLKIRRDMGRMRESLSFGGVASGIAASGTARELAVGLLLTGLGGRRVSRVVAFAGRVLVVARIALAAFGMVRPGPKPAEARAEPPGD